MNELVVVVPGRPPTPNARPGNWQANRRVYDEWRDTAHNAAKAARLLWEHQHHARWQPLTSAELAVAIIVPTRGRRDFDNGVCSLKPLTDGIVAAGVLVDDSTEVVTAFSCSYVYEPKRSEVVYHVRG